MEEAADCESVVYKLVSFSQKISLELKIKLRVSELHVFYSQNLHLSSKNK